MRHRWLRVALLLFVTAWFGVVVPGHRRGQIALPGWQKSCCALPASHARDDSQPRPQPSTPCAVCHFLAFLDLPTPVQLEVPPLAFASPADFPLPHSPFAAEHRSTCLERGPPTA